MNANSTGIQIVIGSVTGTAEGIANVAGKHLEARGFHVSLNRQFSSGDLDGSDALLICTSNTGMGDLPASIAPLLVHLQNDFPRIAGRPYGVINLGDSSYPNFAEAGEKLSLALEDIGAIALTPSLVLDAQSDVDYEAEVIGWLNNWVEKLHG